MHRIFFLFALVLLIGCPPSSNTGDDDVANDDDSAVANDDDSTEEQDCLGDYEPTFDANQCLDFSGGAGMCDDVGAVNPVCDLAVSCGIEPDISQCTIDCSMLTTINCYSETDVSCVRAAACANDCDALVACGYFL